MDLNASEPTGTVEETPEDWDAVGPKAFGDPMGTPAVDEKVLWRGRPDVAPLARSAFHTRKVAIYFAILIGLSVAYGNTDAAIVCAVLGLLALAILNGLAWVSVRTTLYILTDTRLIMRIGMALETRVNIPLKHIKSADLRMRGKSHGDIALKLGGERLLGYALLWPHARPWRFSEPELMLRAVPDAEELAQILADACAKAAPVEGNAARVSAEHKATETEITGYAEGELKGAHA